MDAMRVDATENLSGSGLEAALRLGLPPTIEVQQSRGEFFSSFYNSDGEETGVDVSDEKPYTINPEGMHIKQQPGQPGGQDIFLPEHVLALAERQGGSNPALVYEMQERALSTVLMHYDGLTGQELAGTMESCGYDSKDFSHMVDFFEQYELVKGREGYFPYSRQAIEEARQDAAPYMEAMRLYARQGVPVGGNGNVSESEWPLQLEDTLTARDIKERLSIVSPPGNSPDWSRRTYTRTLPHTDLTYDSETGEILTEAVRNIPKKKKPEYHVAHMKRFKEQEREALFSGNVVYQTSDGREPTDMLIDPSLSHDHDEFHELEVLYAREIEEGNLRHREQEAQLYAPPS